MGYTSPYDGKVGVARDGTKFGVGGRARRWLRRMVTEASDGE
jgi:hypothetical protein